MTPEGQELLLTGAQQLGIQLSAGQQEQFAQLLGLLTEANSRVNLTALKSEHDIVLKHFVDSLSCLRGDHLGQGNTVLDLGTGGGFPSLPLAIVRPDLRLTPLDSTRKKIDFVRETAIVMGLGHVSPIVGRAEALGQMPSHRAHYDRVVCRAVAALPILVELALPLLKVGGLVVAQKGPMSQEELLAGRRAAAEVGGQISEVDEFSLPVLGDRRTLVVIEKTKSTPARYPRREGVPNAQPLFWKPKG